MGCEIPSYLGMHDVGGKAEKNTLTLWTEGGTPND